MPKRKPKKTKDHEQGKPAVNRNIKDRLFRFIFGNPEHKEWSLALYNALENTSYTNPDDLEIITLDNAIYMRMKNDASILVDSRYQSFWEQQSSPNPNIPYRDLKYYVSSIEKYVYMNHLNEYSSKPMKLPRPKFYVFYNGKEKMEKITILKLSDLFYNDGDDDDISLELIVTQYNLNHPDIKPMACKQLYEYQWFVSTVRANKEKMDISDAVSKALDDMPEDFTIREFMIANRKEVIEMSLFEFDEEYYMNLFKEEYLQEGIQKGIQKGIQEGISRGIDSERIQGIRSAFALLKGAGISEEDSIMRIAAQYHLSDAEIRRILSEAPDRH